MELIDSDFPALSTKDKKHRTRHRNPGPENLLYKEETKIKSLDELQKLLKQEIPTTAVPDEPFEIQVAISLSQVTPVSRFQLKAEKELQEENIHRLDQKIDDFEVVLKDLETKIKEVEHNLQQLAQEREFEEQKKTQKPLHITLRNLGEFISFGASPSEIKTAFFELPTHVQKILLKVENLIPEEILPKPVPVPVFQAIAMPTEIRVSAKPEPYTFVQQVGFKACAFLKKNIANVFAMVSLGDTIDVVQALEQLHANEHPVIKDICKVSCISDVVNDCLSLSLYDETNTRHTKMPPGVLPMIVLYHITNEDNVMKMIKTDLSQGIWDTEYKKDLHKRLVANRNKML